MARKLGVVGTDESLRRESALLARCLDIFGRPFYFLEYFWVVILRNCLPSNLYLFFETFLDGLRARGALTS